MPLSLDFPGLADGVVRNNVGVDSIVVGFVATTENGRVRAEATRQEWLLEPGSLAATGDGRFSWFEVKGLDQDGMEPTLRFLGRTEGPQTRPTDLPSRPQTR